MQEVLASRQVVPIKTSMQDHAVAISVQLQGKVSKWRFPRWGAHDVEADSESCQNCRGHTLLHGF